MVLLTTSWSLSFRDDLAYPRTGSPALRDRLWTLLLTLLGGLSVPFLLMAVLVSIYYRITRPISFIMGGMFVSLLANLVSMVANVVVHITANDKMHYICYRSGVSDSTCAYSIADEIYCGTRLQDLCTVFLLGFDGTVCSLTGMIILLVSGMVHAYKQRNKMKQVIRAQEADFDFVLHINDVDT
jgi:hypothetical protein